MIDPEMPGYAEMKEALGTDAVPLADGLLKIDGQGTFYRVAVVTLGAQVVTRIARIMARIHGISFSAAYMELVQQHGLAIPCIYAYACNDPQVGRDFYKSVARLARGNDA